MRAHVCSWARAQSASSLELFADPDQSVTRDNDFTPVILIESEIGAEVAVIDCTK